MRFYLITAILLLSLPTGGCAQAKTTGVKVNEKASVEEKFLDRLAGNWTGEGTSEGREVRDEMSFEWTLDNKFLRLRYRALKGDEYKGEGYFRFDKERDRFEYYEFNNGKWPVRQGFGKLAGNSLVFSEQRADVNIRLIIELVSADSIKITEAYIREKSEDPFVTVTFRRKGTR